MQIYGLFQIIVFPDILCPFRRIWVFWPYANRENDFAYFAALFRLEKFAGFGGGGGGFGDWVGLFWFHVFFINVSAIEKRISAKIPAIKPMSIATKIFSIRIFMCFVSKN